MEYLNGKIYKILNYITDDVYVGSTCQPLSKRMGNHRSVANYGKTKYKLHTKMRELGVEQFYIELIEECPCDNKEQLRKREGEFIRQMGTLNKLVAGRTPTEWGHEYYIANKECKDKQNKLWKESNEDKVIEYKKKWYAKNFELLQEKRRANKEQISEYKKRKYTCECGSCIRRDDKAIHERTLKHQNYLKQLEQNTESSV